MPQQGPPPARATKGRSAYLAYRSLAAALQLLPRPLASNLATLGGLAMAEVSRDRRPVVRANLRRVLGPGATEGELDRAVLEAFESYARYWVESARLIGMRPKDVLERFSVEGFEPLQDALESGSGAIVALPHLGSWDVGGLWLTLTGNPMTTVVEPIEPPELLEWFSRQRAELGLSVLTPEPGTTAKLLEVLRRGRLVALVADRDIAGNGVEVDFFGERTTLPGGPALLALRSGAPLFAAAVYQRPGGYYHAVVTPPLVTKRTGRLRDDVLAVTSRLAGEFENLIRMAPSQWHMFQPNWPSDRGS
ncbi:MAG: phosphatidylinositol mannoside acyltransferase [Acidimicrobiales bacterium]